MSATLQSVADSLTPERKQLLTAYAQHLLDEQRGALTISNCDDPRPHYVYRMFDGDDLLLYIGCTRDMDKRMAWHLSPTSGSATSAVIAKRMARYTLAPYPTKATAMDAERFAIEAEAPLLNKQYNVHRKSA